MIRPSRNFGQTSLLNCRYWRLCHVGHNDIAAQLSAATKREGEAPAEPDRDRNCISAGATLEMGGCSSFRATNRMSNSVTIPIGLGGSLAPSENLLGKQVFANLLCRGPRRNPAGEAPGETSTSLSIRHESRWNEKLDRATYQSLRQQRNSKSL